MKPTVSIGALLVALVLGGCESSQEDSTVEKGRSKGDASKLILGPQSPTPPIEPSPVPSLPANVKEGMDRKDPEPGPDMTDKAKPPEASKPDESTTPKADAPR